jgi:hypothetical protein
MPFEDKYRCYIEIFNEVCVMLVTYDYMFFCQSFEPNETMGKAFKSIYVLNFAGNILKIAYSLTLTVIPKLYKQFRIRRDASTKIENPRLEWFDKKLNLKNENPECPLAIAYHNYSLKLLKDEEKVITSEIYCLNILNKKLMNNLIIKR